MQDLQGAHKELALASQQILLMRIFTPMVSLALPWQIRVQGRFWLIRFPTTKEDTLQRKKGQLCSIQQVVLLIQRHPEGWVDKEKIIGIHLRRSTNTKTSLTSTRAVEAYLDRLLREILASNSQVPVQCKLRTCHQTSVRMNGVKSKSLVSAFTRKS